MTIMLADGRFLEGEEEHAFERAIDKMRYKLDDQCALLIDEECVPAITCKPKFAHWDAKSVVIYSGDYFADVLVAVWLGLVPYPSPASAIVVASRSVAHALMKTGLDIDIVADLDEEKSFNHKNGSYTGPLPLQTQRRVLQEIFVEDANALFDSEIFADNKEHRGFSSYAKARNLMEALALGNKDLPTLPKEVKDDVPEWVSTRWRVRTNTFDADLEEEISIYRKYADLSHIWQSVCADSPLCVRLDSSDLSGRNKTAVAMSVLGEALHISSYVEALAKGVPADDILA